MQDTIEFYRQIDRILRGETTQVHYMYMYEQVYSACHLSPNPRPEELLDVFANHVETHLRKALPVILASENILKAYENLWKTYSGAIAMLRGIYSPLDSWVVKKQQDLYQKAVLCNFATNTSGSDDANNTDVLFPHGAIHHLAQAYAPSGSTLYGSSGGGGGNSELFDAYEGAEILKSRINSSRSDTTQGPQKNNIKNKAYICTAAIMLDLWSEVIVRKPQNQTLNQARHAIQTCFPTNKNNLDALATYLYSLQICDVSTCYKLNADDKFGESIFEQKKKDDMYREPIARLKSQYLEQLGGVPSMASSPETGAEFNTEHSFLAHLRKLLCTSSIYTGGQFFSSLYLNCMLPMIIESRAADYERTFARTIDFFDLKRLDSDPWRYDIQELYEPRFTDILEGPIPAPLDELALSSSTFDPTTCREYIKRHFPGFTRDAAKAYGLIMLVDYLYGRFEREENILGQMLDAASTNLFMLLQTGVLLLRNAKVLLIVYQQLILMACKHAFGIISKNLNEKQGGLTIKSPYLSALNKLFKLLNRIPHGEKLMCASSYKGLSEFSKLMHGTERASHFIEYFILQRNLQVAIQKVFAVGLESSTFIVSKVETVIIELVNRFPASMAACRYTPAEAYAKFIDHIFKKWPLRAYFSETVQKDVIIDQMTNIFRYITDKDVFQKHYQVYLTTRILFKQSICLDEERSFLQRLKEVAGYEYIVRINKVFQDKAISEEFMDRVSERDVFNVENLASVVASEASLVSKKIKIDPLRDRVEGIQSIRKVSVFVSTSSCWPFKKAFEDDFVVPEILVPYLKTFEAFYMHEFLGRKLQFMHSYSQCELSAQFSGSEFTMICNTYQISVLLLFNHEPSLRYMDMKESTGLSAIGLQRVLHLLLEIKLVENTNVMTGNKTIDANEVNNGSSSSVEQGVFRINEGFVPKTKRLNLFEILHKLGHRTRISGRTHASDQGLGGTISGAGMDGDQQHQSQKQQQQVEGVQEAIENERKYFLEATVVRLMKASKVLSHQMLVMKIAEHAEPMFKPQVSSIKQVIETLIEREYLERDPADPSSYRYLA